MGGSKEVHISTQFTDVKLVCNDVKDRSLYDAINFIHFESYFVSVGLNLPNVRAKVNFPGNTYGLS